MILVSIISALITRLFFVIHKELINELMDIYAPNWARCIFCRGYNFGVIEGVFWGVVINSMI
jgi:hypothetical protein